MDLPLPTLAASLDCDPQPLLSALLTAAANGGSHAFGEKFTSSSLSSTTNASIVWTGQQLTDNDSSLFLNVQSPNGPQTFGSAFELFTLLCMIAINLAVVVGNALVILSVFVYGKLRTVTNFFIVSLAVADLMLGIMVLPYALTQTVRKTHFIKFVNGKNQSKCISIKNFSQSMSSLINYLINEKMKSKNYRPKSE